LLVLPSSEFIGAPALHVRIEHFQGSAAGVTAATKPLFRDQRPEQEKAGDYLPSLSDAIKKLPEGSKNAAALLFFQLLDPSPFASGQNQCR
jgi:hypothetical protein